MHAQIQKVLSEGPNFVSFLFFSLMAGGGGGGGGGNDPNTTIRGPSSARLAC